MQAQQVKLLEKLSQVGREHQTNLTLVEKRIDQTIVNSRSQQASAIESMIELKLQEQFGLLTRNLKKNTDNWQLDHRKQTKEIVDAVQDQNNKQLSEIKGLLQSIESSAIRGKANASRGPDDPSQEDTSRYQAMSNQETQPESKASYNPSKYEQREELMDR